jgi:N-methylhydantoinase B
LQACSVNINSERTIDPPWGLWKGHPGASAFAEIERRDGRVERVLKGTAIALAAGDRVTFYTGGGGGWGDPLERDPHALAEDVRRGFVSREAMAAEYGVRVDEPAVVA